MIQRLFDLINEFTEGKSTIFAQKAGIPKGTFGGYLKGRIPRAEHLVRIRETYGITIDWLLTGEGPKYTQKEDSELQPLDPNPEISELMEGARRVLTSGIQEAYDALERNIRYFSIAIAAEKRADKIEKDIELLKEEIRRLKRENLRLDQEEGEQSSGKKVA